MAWEQLSINKPHLVYIILGGFTSIFMLVSLFIKEKLYIGEATVATICGVIFGPHAANLIDPGSWGNVDKITLEFSRIVLVVQCFAVGVELPKAYMERHWRSVVFLLVPVMTFGWLITSLFIWWLIEPLTWLESLIVAACVTATDPVLASSVVGKGKFAKRVPKHLRDVLSAESGCNDGMAFPFIYLSLYLLRYHLDAKHVIYHWTCFTILYECIFGAFYGVMVGYIGRHAIKLAERKGIIDRESFLVFYFTLALFCAGSGSLLGMDDLLVGFAAGVGFSNDGWFTEKTEESHVSNVIDLLLNLAYFVYFGTIIPWDQFNAPDHGLEPWRLVSIAILVIFFRRIPAMLALKPLIPDIKTWREALFAGHFGPIGVGAIFVAILARAELETESTEPLAELPAPGSKDYDIIYLVWPIVTFLVMASIVVHGSSIAVFTLGKRINTLTITLSYTQDNEKGPIWMNRLPRISSQSRSMSRVDSSDLDDNEKLDFPPGQLPPIGIPKLQLRRQKEEDYEKPARRRRHKKDWDVGGPISQSAIRPAPRSESSPPQGESGSDTLFEKSNEPSPDGKEDYNPIQASSSSSESGERRPKRSRSLSPGGRADVEAYEEGHKIVIEDTEGNVLETVDTTGKTPEQKADIIEQARRRLSQDKTGEFAKRKHESHPKDEGEEWQRAAAEAVGMEPEPQKKKFMGMPMSSMGMGRFDQWKGFGRNKEEEEGQESSRRKEEPPKRKRGPAHAYQFGNTIIVEDEDGEVIKTYKLPGAEGSENKYGQEQMREGLRRMSTWVGFGKGGGASKSDAQKATEAMAASGDGEPRSSLEGAQKSGKKHRKDSDDPEVDDGLRMVISRTQRYGLTGLHKDNEDEGGQIQLGSGRRLSTRDFLAQMQRLDPKSKLTEIDESNAPEDIKREAKKGLDSEKATGIERPRGNRAETSIGSNTISTATKRPDAARRTQSDRPTGISSTDDKNDNLLKPPTRPQPTRSTTNESTRSMTDIAEEEEQDIPHHDVRSAVVRHGKGQTAAEERRERLATIVSNDDQDPNDDEEGEEGEEGETAAEKRRRLAALGHSREEDSSSESEEEAYAYGQVPRRAREATQEPGAMEVGAAANRRLRVQWGGERGRDQSGKGADSDEDREPEHTGVAAAAGAAGRKVRGMFKNKP